MYGFAEFLSTGLWMLKVTSLSLVARNFIRRYIRRVHALSMTILGVSIPKVVASVIILNNLLKKRI